MVGEVCKTPIYLASASLYMVKWGVNRMNERERDCRIIEQNGELVLSVVFVMGLTL